MKMGKLFSSIATATMVLTTLAPAAVANAATGYPVTSDGVSQTPSSGGSLPAATYGKEKNSTSGSVVTATSDASVNVIDGYLILQSVPNFGFGAAVAGNTADLVNYENAGRGANDAGDSGLLTILDSRHSQAPAAGGPATPQDGMGFTLTLALGGFNHNGTTTTTRPDTDKFSLDFVKGSAGLREQYNKNNNFEPVEASPMTIKEGNSDTLITSSKKSGGKHTWAFTGKDVKLNVPPTAAEGQWYATMTWTLKSLPA